MDKRNSRLGFKDEDYTKDATKTLYQTEEITKG
jgi:hypothetical protein